MSDSGEAPEAPPQRASRTRALMRRTSHRQRLGAGAAVALLITAPFGGLKAAETPGPDKLEPGRTFALGPFDVTIRKVVTVPDLAPSIRPERKGDRLLVLVGRVHNPGRRPEFGNLITSAINVRGGGVLSPADDGTPTQLVSVTDGENISTINPGLTYDVAIVLEQKAGWQGMQVSVDIDGYDYLEEDPLTLDPQSWLDTDEVATRGRFTVEVRP